MAKTNDTYTQLSQWYLFSEIAKRTKSFIEKNPGVQVMRLGIGNTTEPLVPAAIRGLSEGVNKLSRVGTYTGYGDEQGDSRLRQAVTQWYKKRRILLEESEVFISDGAKTDCANITSIFAPESIVAISDPVYPVYLDANIIAGKEVIFLPARKENGFIPAPPTEKVDIIFLCSPNNPTGAVATKKQLKEFVDYAVKNKAVIIFDAAYSEYIQDENLPRSIYEIDGARQCAVEIQSFSKSAGFTGVRLGWTVVPKSIVLEDSSIGELNQIWNRRQTTMFNGASNIVQEGGLAVLTDEGQRQTHAQVQYYMQNAHIIKAGLEELGLEVYGGVNAPYIWIPCPNGLTSWEFFDLVLENAHVVTTPGSGFGKLGEGYMRLSAFGHRENIQKAVESIKKNIKI